MIETYNLKKIYKIKKKKGLFKSEIKEIIAVNDINLNIKPGQIVGLIGINGAGKTTTIKMLSTLLIPDGGYGLIDGLDLVKDSTKIKNKINMIIGGERMIYWRLTAKENLEYFGRLYNISKDELNKRIDALLDFVGLTERANQPVEQYSKGMKQRLQIAKGLINDPKYLFLDEPTLGLDANIAKIIRKKIYQLAKEKRKGILLTSHYINEIEELCDYIYIINKGKIIAEGTASKISKITSHLESKYIIEITSLTENLKTDLINFFKKNQCYL